MNEYEAVTRVVEVLTEGLDDSVNVKTEGGGEFMELPCVIVSWTTSRLDRLHGNNPWAGVKRDENGEIIGQVYHVYYEMRLDLWIKTYDDEPITSRPSTTGERGRDQLVNAVHEHFVPYEYNPERFHEDTFEWQVENAVSRSKPTEEPNWFETDQVVTFRYVKEVVDTDIPDVLEDVDANIRTVR